MKFCLAVCLMAGSASALASPPDKSYDTSNTKVGTTLQVVIPLIGLGLTWLLDPPSAPPATDSTKESGLFGWNHMSGSPRHDFFLAFGRTEFVTLGLKAIVEAKRPNGGSHSFPSGHTSASFMGAEFIRKEYGLWYGTPAYLAASYVGWSRQQSRNHYTRDVLAGAAIGILSNHDWSELKTGFGSLSLAPALLPLAGESSTDWRELTQSFDRPATGLPSMIPGLSLQWRF